MIALLDINVAVDILRMVDDTWCEVRTGSPPKSGFAACAFLAAEPVSAVNLREHLEQTRRVDGGGGEEALDMLERLFALEPSAEVLDEYVLRMKLVYGYDLHWAMSDEPDPRPEMARRGESYRLMRRRLTRDALPELAAEFASAGGKWYRPSRSGLGVSDCA